MLAVVSALCMICAVVPVLPESVPETAVISASAEGEEEPEYTYENLKYKKYADYVEISGVTDREITEALIPAEIDGLPVTSIGEWAFYNYSGLTSVTIPDSVTSIGGRAFEYCSGLTSVTIENPDCEIYDVSFTISNGHNEDDVAYFNGTIYSYENSTAQAYAEKYKYKFESLGSAPETTEPTETEPSAPVEPAEDMVWNGVNPDINRDGTIDAADSAVLLTYAAEFGAGKVTSFKEFMDKNYGNS